MRLFCAVLSLMLPPLSATAQELPRVVPYQVVNARSIPESLTGAVGDPKAGRRLYLNAESGCAICHGMPGESAPAPGAGHAPDLAGLTDRMEVGTARLWIVAPTVLNPETEMPAYYAAGQRTDPLDPRFGEPLLSAAEIEDILAFLMTSGAER